MLKNNKHIVGLKKLTPTSKLNSLIFNKLIFPVTSELNICNSWKDILEFHRKEEFSRVL